MQQFETHALAIHDAEREKTRVWKSVQAGAVSAVAIGFIFAPQQTYLDSPSFVRPSVVAGNTPAAAPFFQASPQADTTQIAPAVWTSAPKPPVVVGVTTFYTAAPQAADLTQQPAIWGALRTPPPPGRLSTFFSIPPQPDMTQPLSVWASIQLGSAPIAPPNLHRLFIDLDTGHLIYRPGKL